MGKNMQELNYQIEHNLTIYGRKSLKFTQLNKTHIAKIVSFPSSFLVKVEIILMVKSSSKRFPLISQSSCHYFILFSGFYEQAAGNLSAANGSAGPYVELYPTYSLWTSPGDFILFFSLIRKYQPLSYLNYRYDLTLMEPSYLI